MEDTKNNEKPTNFVVLICKDGWQVPIGLSPETVEEFKDHGGLDRLLKPGETPPPFRPSEAFLDRFKSGD